MQASNFASAPWRRDGRASRHRVSCLEGVLAVCGQVLDRPNANAGGSTNGASASHADSAIATDAVDAASGFNDSSHAEAADAATTDVAATDVAASGPSAFSPSTCSPSASWPASNPDSCASRRAPCVQLCCVQSLRPALAARPCCPGQIPRCRTTTRTSSKRPSPSQRPGHQSVDPSGAVALVKQAVPHAVALGY